MFTNICEVFSMSFFLKVNDLTLGYVSAHFIVPPLSDDLDYSVTSSHCLSPH